jgi:hypothetical protein
MQITRREFLRAYARRDAHEVSPLPDRAGGHSAGLCEQGVTPNAQANSAARCCPIAGQAAGSRMQVNDHIVEPGDVVFRHACELGFEDRVETARLALYVRPLTALDQEQEPTASGGEAGSGGGLE